jgi:PAS domain S-box-containing protein
VPEQREGCVVSTVFPQSAAPTLLDERPPYIDALPMAVYACDATGLIRWYNVRAARLWGREPRVGIDRYTGALKIRRLDGTEMTLSQGPMASVLRTGIPVDGEQALIERPDGSSFVAMIHVQPIADSSGRLLGAVNCFHETTTLNQEHEATRGREERYRELLDALPAAVYTTDADGRITAFNRAAVALWGCEPEVDGEVRWGAWKLFRPDGSPLKPEEEPMAIALREGRAVRGIELIGERPDGTRYWFIPYPTPLMDAEGKVVGGVNMLVDITNRKASQERIETLSREVNHRAKNMLAVIQSIIRLSTTDPHRAFAETLLGRITALGRAHSLLSENRWQGADLARLVEEELAPFRSGADARATVEGPHLALAPSTAQPLSMALHELATNAVKYGALSVPEGRVSVGWSHESDGRVVLTWAESGGPPVTTTPRRNFGLNVISIVVGSQLGGTVQLDWRPEGLVCVAEIPAAALAQKASGAR